MIYLDSAATSLHKPGTVSEAVARAMGLCASPGRGVHVPAMRAADTMLSCREEAAAFFHVDDPEKVVFTASATHGLNIAIRSLVKRGTRVLTSGWEHNAVMRPLYHIGAALDAAAGPLFDRGAILDSFREKIGGAQAVICTCVSNVFGFLLPYEEIALLCREKGIPLILDASQCAGVTELDFGALGAAFAAMPGHKGLLGPQGTGILLCGNGGEPLVFGGTGGQSERRDMPEELPDRLEAGTPNVCGIAGLREGIRYLRSLGSGEVLRRERELRLLLQDGLRSLGGLQIFSCEGPEQTGVLSVRPEGMDCEELAERLGEAGVAVRPGLHCAPLAHRTAGTIGTGTVRFSVSLFNTRREILQTLDILGKILKNRNKM